jgi:hypothetical protein
VTSPTPASGRTNSSSDNAPELQLHAPGLAGHLDRVGLDRSPWAWRGKGYRLSLSHIAEGEWRATFISHPMISPRGFGVAATPWGAVQRAAWTALKRDEAPGPDSLRQRKRA